MRIAINGAGIAGPTLAYWLRRFGHQPVLFERSPSPRAGGLDIRPMREQLQGRFISLPRTDLAGALLSASRDVPTHFGVSIVGIDQDGEGVTATLSDRRQERFDLVVGADGLYSQVRELAFGRAARFETPLGCHVAAFRMPG